MNFRKQMTFYTNFVYYICYTSLQKQKISRIKIKNSDIYTTVSYKVNQKYFG